MIIDISQHQGEINWRRAKHAGVHMAIIRCTMGASGKDARFLENINGASERGIQVGVYHLWDSTKSAGVQWANFVDSYMGQKALPWGEIHVALDVEDRVMRHTWHMAQMKEWLEMADHASTHTPYIYTAPGVWNPYQNSGFVSWAKDYPLWVAGYSGHTPTLPSDWSEFELWQFSAQGNNCGTYYGTTSLDVDLNMSYAEWVNSRKLVEANA